jgi:hypothetical protein
MNGLSVIDLAGDGEDSNPRGLDLIERWPAVTLENVRRQSLRQPRIRGSSPPPPQLEYRCSHKADVSRRKRACPLLGGKADIAK